MNIERTSRAALRATAGACQEARAQGAPIGVFDSGVGGLSVLRAIRAELPLEDLLYVADSGNAPYGDRDAGFIIDRATLITRSLLAQGVKAIVVACNTATVVAVAELRSWCPVPVVAMEPAIKPASRSTRSGVVGVLATSQTLASPSVARLCDTWGDYVQFVLQPCPGLVERVERAQLSDDATRALLAGYLAPLLAAGADTVVLGCTHYPFVAPLIRDIVGPDIAIVDPAAAIAKELSRRLGERRVSAPRERPPQTLFFSSADPAAAGQVVSALWGSAVAVRALATIDDQRAAAPPPRP